MKQEEKTDDTSDKTKYHMPRVQHEELAQILKKIGSNDETQKVNSNERVCVQFGIRDRTQQKDVECPNNVSRSHVSEIYRVHHFNLSAGITRKNGRDQSCITF